MKFANLQTLLGTFGPAACGKNIEIYNDKWVQHEGETGIELTVDNYVRGMDMKMEVFWCAKWLSKKDQLAYAQWAFDQIAEYCPDEAPVPPGPRQNQVDDPDFIIANEAWVAKECLTTNMDPFDKAMLCLGRMVKIRMLVYTGDEKESVVKRNIKIEQLTELVRLTRGE